MALAPDRRIQIIEGYAAIVERAFQLSPEHSRASRIKELFPTYRYKPYADSPIRVSQLLSNPKRSEEIVNKLDQDFADCWLAVGSRELQVLSIAYGLEEGLPLGLTDISNNLGVSLGYVRNLHRIGIAEARYCLRRRFGDGLRATRVAKVGGPSYREKLVETIGKFFSAGQDH